MSKKARLLCDDAAWCVFTDGSASVKTREGGWAFVAFNLDDKTFGGYGWEANTTIGKMELFAPTQALFHLFCFYGRCNVLVYCDSEYVVKGITDRTRNRRVNREYWEMLDRNTDLHNEVVYEHIDGHSGSHYNDLADKMAVRARKEQLRPYLGELNGE